MSSTLLSLFQSVSLKTEMHTFESFISSIGGNTIVQDKIVFSTINFNIIYI